MKVTGILRNVTFQGFEGGFVAWGYVYDDVHGRFRDGDRIHTSYVKDYDASTGILTTRNSFYKIGSLAPGVTMPTNYRQQD